MKRFLLAWLLISCAAVQTPTTQTGAGLELPPCLGQRCLSRLQKPHWDDFWRTLESIRCALAIFYDPERALKVVSTVRIFQVPHFALAGEYHPATKEIWISAEARTALAGALRHELFFHATPDVLTNDPKPCGGCTDEQHDPLQRVIAGRLDELASQCRKAMSHTSTISSTQ